MPESCQVFYLPHSRKLRLVRLSGHCCVIPFSARKPTTTRNLPTENAKALVLRIMQRSDAQPAKAPLDPT